VIATTIPITTTMTMAICIHSQNGFMPDGAYDTH